MSRRRTTFGKLQRDRDKQAKQRAKQQRRAERAEASAATEDAPAPEVDESTVLAQLADLHAAFDDGRVVHTGEDVTSPELARLVEEVPELRDVVRPLCDGDESPAAVASAVELVLEGLHLSKRLNKDAVDGRATYRSRS